jgi:hypothetical protein
MKVSTLLASGPPQQLGPAVLLTAPKTGVVLKQFLGLVNYALRDLGRCYYHNFLRFSTIFGEKLAFSQKPNNMIKILHNLALF